MNSTKLKPQHFALIAALLLAACLIMFVKSIGQPPLRQGWYKTKWLQKHGYTVPAGAKKTIYIRPTAVPGKANILPVAKS